MIIKSWGHVVIPVIIVNMFSLCVKEHAPVVYDKEVAQCDIGIVEWRWCVTEL